MARKDRVPEIPGGIDVLGVNFQSFLDPSTGFPVFSQSGASRGLDIPRRSVVDIMASERFKALRGKESPMGEKLLTEVNSQPILVITQTDLVILVQIGSEKKYPVPQSMQEASFAVLLQQSIDEKLNISRPRKEYLKAGATARQKLEYLHSYNNMKQSTFDGGYGVSGLCKVNRQVSGLAVPDADERRQKDKNWRRECNGEETARITIGNIIHKKAIDASSKGSFEKNLGIAEGRTNKIYDIMNEPFQ